ncbi:F0F1 ATP synthase subunit B' [Rickettsia conorii subsp. heilongjiangensis]|uniref:F0F1 ATP synthase subunit B n=1 Tax=Rickettsia conorii subsp. heilongjiangensis TaxID=226665 RepID=A0AAD1GI00_RICCR|nr:F0F1 ATP synthase subunit B' [Rickettsia conorii]AEK74065.1 F0F1 ATP synthase subunit B' [Rickettsia conorii subsp. heilongjiangensis 054]BBM90862.1 F0F1 ATP synthase subunit B' [Rickettsia conorii subsp. heilongjiangensis]BBM92071.1 F0F1 ATP synthase subunit B' [Rickettsia conorii subsp. heilongjiangensis]BBM93280.1 F0F1 ATP synthase subunit B' [Rickettsia conorii subsp. heilongjiangensis]BBM94489.1 F0F1 ATP synthase subunit B' [Rickettsia conorii subsp. heilongjiangensis]
MPQFDITTYYSQIFWLIVTFGLLYIFVYKFITPKAEEIFNNRKTNIQDNITQADTLTIEVEKLNKYYNEEIDKINTEIDRLKKEKIDSLESEFLIKKKNLEQDLKNAINQNIEDINLAAKQFRTNKSAAIIKLAVNIIEKIAGTKADMNLLQNIKVK